MAKAKLNNPVDADPYLALIHRLPLRPIRTEQEHDRATAVIEELFGRDLDSGSSDYLDTLILLVSKYEDDHHTPAGTHLSPQNTLKAIMNANGLSQAQIGKIIGSESAISMFLSGERELSKAHIKALVARFRIDASLLF